MLLENVEEELDPSLEPVLLKQVFKKGGQYLIRLGSSDVPYNDEFRFFVTTKLANPHYLPEVCIKVTIINFTVTMLGLEDQLLVDVIKNERSDLEEKKDQLVVSIAADGKALQELEDRILYMLANATGNILDDEELINALGQSKVTSKAINVRLVEAEATTKMINETREGYRVVATRGSIIYFVIAACAHRPDVSVLARVLQGPLQRALAALGAERRCEHAARDPHRRHHEVDVRDGSPRAVREG